MFTPDLTGFTDFHKMLDRQDKSADVKTILVLMSGRSGQQQRNSAILAAHRPHRLFCLLVGFSSDLCNQILRLSTADSHQAGTYPAKRHRTPYLAYPKRVVQVVLLHTKRASQ